MCSSTESDKNHAEEIATYKEVQKELELKLKNIEDEKITLESQLAQSVCLLYIT